MTVAIFLFYRLIGVTAAPLLFFYVLNRVFRNRGYLRELGERFGFGRLPSQRTPGAIWIHAVSVGEVLGAVELIAQLREQLPGERIFVSCSTLGGREIAEKRLQVDGVLYLPFDYVFAIRRVLRRLRPTLVIVLETEIWPNFFREVKRTHASLVIVNARISDRARKRYRWIEPALGCVLKLPDAILAQSGKDADTYRELGAPAPWVSGNLKYDLKPPCGIPEAIREFVNRMRPRAIWIAASTMPPLDADDLDEDDVVIEAWKRIGTPDRLLILAPRKPERFETAALKLHNAGIAFVKRSQLMPDSMANVLLVDSIGELGSLFQLPAVVFMGGTLARRGGHNILEPAYFGRPIVTGPNMQNFAEIADTFRGAVEVVSSQDELSQTVQRLLLEPGEMGERAQAIAQRQRGATSRTVAILKGAYEASLPVYRPAQPWFVALWALSWVWRAGSRCKRMMTKAQPLPAPVVSVGGLTMGGAGKTPLVRWLARFYAARRPAILTRGYGRESRDLVTLKPGQPAHVSLTGDEAQMYIRDGIAALGIAADRVKAARGIEAGVFLLDDGFQHARVARNADIVVLDARDPFGGGFVFPLGWMREPVEALARATAVVIARAEPHRSYDGLVACVRKPVWKARVVPEAWVSIETGEERVPQAFEGMEAIALAGIGNPESFLRTLDSLGVKVVEERFFPDHHVYREADLPAPGYLVVTTEKDASKIPTMQYQDVWYLRIGFHLADFSDPLEPGATISD